MNRHVRDGVVAGSVAGALGGLPSTMHGLVVSGRPLDATLAAGSIVSPPGASTTRLLMAAVPTHAALSVGWAIALAAVLPERRTAWWGAAAGAGIAILDLGVLGRRFERIRALPTWPQVADHLVYGAVVGAVVSRGRSAPSSSPSTRRRRRRARRTPRR